MKNLKSNVQIFKSAFIAPGLGVIKKTTVLFVSAALIFASCKKEAADGSATGGAAGAKDAATVSATGRPIITLFPVRGPHNTGWDSATGAAPSSFNCGNTYSNEDWQNSSDPHYGIDIFAAMQTQVKAPTTGILIKNDGNSGYGNRVCIKDANGWYHWLIHMDSRDPGLPALGSTVTAGTPVGKVGITGGSGGVPHLHYHVTPVSDGTSGYWSTGIDFYPELSPTESNVCDSAPACGSVGTFDAFASGVGRYTRQPTYSGSTVGIATTSTATHYVSGSSTHLKLTLNDNTSVTTNWFIRLLSGDGIAANNVCTAKTGTLYYWLKTSNAGTGATARIWVDDSDGTEQSPSIAIINDGAWHKYAFPLSSGTWTAAAGGNGAITAASVTLDAIILARPNNAAQWVAYIDDVGN